VAHAVGGRIRGDGARRVAGVATPATAGPDDLIYIDSPRHAGALQATRAAVALVPPEVQTPAGMTAIEVVRPAGAIARALEIMMPAGRAFEGVSPQAFVDPTAVIECDVGIGPFVYVGPGSRIGRGTQIHPGSTIARDVTIGRDCVLHSGVHVYAGTEIGSRVILHSGVVLGADGFGFVAEPATAGGATAVSHRKVPHVGRVIVEDDVEIGANTSINRAMLDETRIGAGTKIDDLVMVGHNCRIGRHCIIVAQAGISGSSTIGDHATLAGQAGIADHVTVGAGATVGAQAGVTKDVPAGGLVLGSPAIDVRSARRALPLIEHLPAMRRSLAAHDARLERLERQAGAHDDDARAEEALPPSGDDRV
jgi:UDP-3-O-[3-hydroxymyristoyl] glucosamine N-acyltransferase